MENIIWQGSCSESTMILDISELTNIEEQELVECLEKLSNEENEEWYDTTWFKTTLDKRGVKLISIKGDTPYNNLDWLTEQLSKLQFWKKIDVLMEGNE